MGALVDALMVSVLPQFTEPAPETEGLLKGVGWVRMAVRALIHVGDEALSTAST